MLCACTLHVQIPFQKPGRSESCFPVFAEREAETATLTAIDARRFTCVLHFHLGGNSEEIALNVVRGHTQRATYMHMHMHMCMHMYMCMCMCMCMCTCSCTRRPYMCMHMCMCMC